MTIEVRKLSIRAQLEIVGAGLFAALESYVPTPTKIVAGAALKAGDRIRPRVRRVREVVIEPAAKLTNAMVEVYVKPRVTSMVRIVGKEAKKKAKSTALSVVRSKRVHTALAQGTSRALEGVIALAQSPHGRLAVGQLALTVVQAAQKYLTNNPAKVQSGAVAVLDSATTALQNHPELVARTIDTGLRVLDDPKTHIALVRLKDEMLGQVVIQLARSEVQATASRLVSETTHSTFDAVREALEIQAVREELLRLAQEAVQRAKEELKQPETKETVRDAIRFFGDAAKKSSKKETGASENESIYERIRKMFREDNQDPFYTDLFHTILSVLLAGYCHTTGAVIALVLSLRDPNRTFSKFTESQKNYANMTASGLSFLSTIFTA